MGVFKNGVGRPSNETIKKRNIFKGLCVVLLIITIALVTYIINNNMKSNINDKKVNKKNKDKVVDVSNSEEIKELFNKMNGYTSELSLLTNTSSEYDYFYKDKTINNEDVTDEIKFAIAYNDLYRKKINKVVVSSNNTDNFDNFKFSLDDINIKVNDFFSNNINVNNIIDDDKIVNLSIDGVGFKYDDKEKSFSLLNKGFGSCFINEYQTKIISAKKYSNKIEIVNKVMFLHNSMCDGEKQVLVLKHPYSSKNYKENIIEDLIESKKDYDFVNIDDYKDFLNSYKWVFTKNKEGNYIFSSVERSN